MDVIALTIFGFLLLGFVLYWRYRHRGKVEAFLESNQNVMPLFREKSAHIKYEILHEALKNSPLALAELEQLRQAFKENRMNAENYEAQLSEMQEQYIKR